MNTNVQICDWCVFFNDEETVNDDYNNYNNQCSC
jgi:hypothetical protein